MSLSLFLPVRKGSERIPHKNTRNFGGIKGGLLEFKLNQFIDIQSVNEIVVSSNDEKCLEISSTYVGKIQNLKVIERPGELGSSHAKISDLIKYAGEVCTGEHVLWTHVTSPFFLAENYNETIRKYFEIKRQGFDSLITGNEIQEYLIDTENGKLINNPSLEQWPRTQDLKKLFQINNAVFFAERLLYREGKRTGAKPFFMTVNKLASLDIDWEEDFKIAEAIYERIYK